MYIFWRGFSVGSLDDGVTTIISTADLTRAQLTRSGLLCQLTHLILSHVLRKVRSLTPSTARNWGLETPNNLLKLHSELQHSDEAEWQAEGSSCHQKVHTRKKGSWLFNTEDLYMQGSALRKDNGKRAKTCVYLQGVYTLKREIQLQT